MPYKGRLIDAVARLNANVSNYSNSSAIDVPGTVVPAVLNEDNPDTLPRTSSPILDGYNVLEPHFDSGEGRLGSEPSHCSSITFNDDSLENGTESQPVWRIGGLNCKLNEDELIIALLAIQNSHRLSDTSMESYCALLNVLLPNVDATPLSYKGIIRKASEKFSEFNGKISYICSGKECTASFQKQIDSCTQPRCEYFQRKHQATGFVNFKIRPQIEMLIQKYFPEMCREVSKANACRSGCVSDILSSNGYAQRQANCKNDGNDFCINLLLSSDGAQPFHCGGFCLWPCAAIVCELPPKIRASCNNAIVFGFWVGNHHKKKLMWRLFLESAIAELNCLREYFPVTINNRTIRVKVEIFGTLFDLPAQASIWAHKQFNGLYGCMACWASGQRPPGARTLLWPKTRDRRGKTKHFYKTAWANVELNPKYPFYGVIGISPLSKLVNPAEVNIFDPMHMVYRGNAMLLFSRFFESKPGQWSSLFKSKELQELTADLATVEFPIEFKRTIPDLVRLATFKASELKNLLLYAFVPATAAFMSPLPDYWHWAAIFVHAIRLLSQPTVSEDDVQCAKTLIDAWQELIPELASESSQTYNAHGVQHLPAQVMKFGPLWATSAFCFESFNGEFVRRINSAKGPVQQIARRFVLQRFAGMMEADLKKRGLALSAVIAQITGKMGKDGQNLPDESRVRLGKCIPRFSNAAVTASLVAYFGFLPDNVKFSMDVFMNGARFQAALHRDRRCSSRIRCLAFKHSDSSNAAPLDEYASAVAFFELGSVIYAVCKKFEVLSRTNIHTVPAPVNKRLFTLYSDCLYGSFFTIVKRTENLILLPVDDIVCKVILIPYDDQFIATDVLPFEHN